MLQSIIRRRFSSRILVAGIPTEWDQKDIHNRFGVVGSVAAVNLVLGQKGVRTGKAVVTFDNKSTADKAIEMFDNVAWAKPGLVCRVVPYNE